MPWPVGSVVDLLAGHAGGRFRFGAFEERDQQAGCGAEGEDEEGEAFRRHGGAVAVQPHQLGAGGDEQSRPASVVSLAALVIRAG